MHRMRYNVQLLNMFLDSPDVLYVIGCGIGQEYGLHQIWVYIVLVFVQHDRFVSLTTRGQALSLSLPVFQLVILQPYKKVVYLVVGIKMCS